MEKCYEMEIFTQICDCIGREGRFTGNGTDYVWSDGDRILCSREKDADTIAAFLELIGYEEVRISYYDPADDARDGKNDEYTGMWAVEHD